jgi:hypothetical protein
MAHLINNELTDIVLAYETSRSKRGPNPTLLRE